MKKKILEAGQSDDFQYAMSPVAQRSGYDLDEEGPGDPRVKGSAPANSKDVVKQYLQSAGPDKAKDQNDPNYVRDFLMGLGYPEEKVTSLIQSKMSKPKLDQRFTQPEQKPKKEVPPQPQKSAEPESDHEDLGSGLDTYTKNVSTALTPSQQEDFEKVQRFVKSGVLSKRQLQTLMKELENDE